MKLSNLKHLVLLAGLGLSASAFAAVTLVHDVRVFDGERMHARRSVLIDGATIVNADFKGKAPAGAMLIDGAGKTLLPGLIDAHVHAYRHLELPLLFGVTTQVDMFTGVAVMQGVTKKMREGANSGQADLFSAGTLATAPGGHGTEYGMPIPTLTTPAEAQAFVDARLAEGSHFIKIVMEEGLAGRKMNSLDLATVRALIQAAHSRKKLAVVHISNLANARAALEAGADGLVHLFVGKDVDAGAIEALAVLARQRKAFVIPTFSVMESMAGIKAADVLGDPGLTNLLDKEQAEPLGATYGRQPNPALLNAPNALTLALHKAGVPLLAGTDAGNAGTQHGISLHHEMASLVRAGLSPLQALAAATAAPARAFQLGRRGRIAAGYKADLLLVAGDPAADIANTRNIVMVWKDGVDAAGLRSAQLARVAQEKLPKNMQPLALPPDGRISLFTKDKLASPIGHGWMQASDAFMGGKSNVKLDLREPVDGQAVLAVNANVVEGFAYPWAGLSFMPGKQPMAAADLSAAKVIRFKVRGDGGQYSLNVMGKGAQMPVSVPFTAESGWREVAIPFSAFKGIDASAITMIAFNAGPKPGTYAFELSDVRLMTE
ncbi:MAG: CIA30 family protein [Pseudomonadota bacterium]